MSMNRAGVLRKELRFLREDSEDVRRTIGLLQQHVSEEARARLQEVLRVVDEVVTIEHQRVVEEAKRAAAELDRRA